MLKNKKIVYLITQSKYGGAQRYVLDLASYFQQNNQVILTIGEKNDQDQDFFALAKERGLTWQIIPSLRRAIDLGANVVGLMEIYKMLKREKPDILHINSSMAGFLGAIAALIYNLNPYARHIRVIYTAHGFVFNEPLPSSKKKMYLWLERISAAWKHAIITVSDFDRQSAIKAGFKGDKLFVIHPGLPVAQSAPSKEEIRQILGLKSEATIIGTIASHYPTKDLPTLIRSLQHLPTSVSLVIIGDGPERHNIEKNIEKLLLTNRVTLLGARKEGTRYLSAFDIFVLSSVKEGLPYALLEAGQSALPVVATRVGGIPEIIDHQQEGLLVEPGDDKALAESIQILLNDPSTGKIYGQRLRQKIQQEFSLQRMLQQTEALYERLF